MRISWAVDVFEPNQTHFARVGKFLSLLAKKKSDISAVYVASPREPRLAKAFDVPESKRFSAYPLSLLRTATRASKLSVPRDNHIVVPSSALSLTRIADQLCQRVKGVRPDLIAIQTAQRKGLARAVLGSFAETVIHRSRKSIIAMNPSHTLPADIHTILFADDLSPRSSRARQFVADLAKHLKADVRVVHSDYLYGYGRTYKAPHMVEYRTRIDRLLTRSERYFHKKGISVQAHIDGDNTRASDAILAAAKKHRADLIVVAAASGPLVALLGGSVTRQLVRGSVVPVVIFKS